MKIVKIISTWSRKANSRNQTYDGKTITRVPHGHKRVQAIVSFGGEMCTRHIVIPA